MKARIGVMSEELIKKRVLSIAAGEYKPQKDEPKVWFSSINAISQILCSENIKLLKIMKNERPETITELGLLSGRSPSNLSNTLQTLALKGFIRMERAGKSVRPVALFTDFEILAGIEFEEKFSALNAA